MRYFLLCYLLFCGNVIVCLIESSPWHTIVFVRCLFSWDGETHRGPAAGSSYDRGEGQTIFGAGPELPSARSPFLNFLKHLGRNEQLQYHGQSRQNRPASATLRMNTAWAITNRPFLQRGHFFVPSPCHWSWRNEFCDCYASPRISRIAHGLPIYTAG